MSFDRPIAPRAAKRLLVPLVGALLIAPVPAMSAAPQPAWSTVPLAAGAFSASFPVERPSAKSYVRPGGTLRVWFAETRAGLFIAADAPVSGTASAAAEHIVASLDGKLVAAKVTPIHGAPEATRYWFSRGKESGQGVLVQSGRRFYALLAVTGAKDEAAASRFVNSLAVPASAKAAEPLPAKGRTEASAVPSSDAATDFGEHLAAALLIAPAVPAVAKAMTVSPAPAARPRQIAVADSLDRGGIPDPHADRSGDRDGGISAPEGYAGGAIAPAPDPGRSSDATPAAVAPAPPVAVRPPPRTAPPSDPTPASATSASDRDGIPDPHADPSGNGDGAMSTQQGSFGATTASVPDPRDSSDAMLDDVPPASADAPPSALTASPSDLQPAPAVIQRPPAIQPLPPATAAYPRPTHLIWLPATWRWNGYSWEWLPGHWARAID